jgi:hypothetical protein
MRFIKNFERFNDLLAEVRLSDVLNIKSKEDNLLASEIDQLKNVSFDFEKNLVKFITLKKRVNNKKIQFKINWNDTSKHNLRKRISERTSFKTVQEFNNFFKELVNIVFPDYVGKQLMSSGRYSVYSIEYNISIIFEFNFEKYIKNDYEVNVVTILPGRKGLDVVKLIDI